MSKQYHYAVYVTVDDDGTMHPPCVDPDTQVAGGYTIWDDEDGKWYEVDDATLSTDDRAFGYLMDVLRNGSVVVP